MKILLAVDGSEFTQRMLAWLAVHDEVFSAKDTQFTALTVVPALTAHVTRHLGQGQTDGYYQDRAAEVIDPVAEFGRRHGWQLDTRFVVGRPAETLADTAASGRFDLVVLGSHGHSPVTSLVLGSVAQRLLALCTVPTLIIR